VVENLLDQKFNVSVPSTVWGTDITYVPTDEGWLYLAGVKDFASREILGYAMDSRMCTELTRAALRKAVQFSKPLPGCIHHSDRGSQYCASDYRKDVQNAPEWSLQCRAKETAMTTLPPRASGDI
jgi:putative transposase